MSYYLKIDERSMLVKLSISQFTASVFSKQATDIVEQAISSHETGRFTKHLIHRDALKDVRQISNKARAYHYQVTLPWLDDGYRLLPTKLYPSYTKKMRQYKTDFDQAVITIESNYQNIINQAQNRLGILFNANEYPNKIAPEYNMRTDFRPVPTGNDFRCQLPETELKVLKQGVESEIKRNMIACHRDVVKRFKDAIGRAVERLSKTDNVFRDSLIGNLKELSDVIPDLNINDDPDIDRIANDIRKTIATYSPQDIRDDVALRDKARQDAEKIQSDIDAIEKSMGAIYDSIN